MKTKFELNLATLVRWFLAAVLILAAVSKLTDRQDFYNDILRYQLPLPQSLLNLAAFVLPWAELACGLVLFSRVRLAITLAIVLFGIFALVSGQAWARGLNISCGCFKLRNLGITLNAGGRIEHLVESPAFACLRAVVLLLAALWLLKTKSAPPTRSDRAKM
jgi:methylamine utilization protein MauE